MAGWPTTTAASALAELAKELEDRSRVYQNFGLMNDKNNGD